MTILEGTIDYPPSCDTDAKRAWFREAIEEIRKAAAPRVGEHRPDPRKNPPWPHLPRSPRLVELEPALAPGAKRGSGG